MLITDKRHNQIWGVKRLDHISGLLQIIEGFISLTHCYFCSLKFFETFDYRYYLLTIYTEPHLNTAE